LDLNLRKKAVNLGHSFFYDAVTWTLQKVCQKYLESFFLKCDGEVWRRSVGPIEWKMRKFIKSQGGEEYRAFNKK
jgi:hypothetical protein